MMRKNIYKMRLHSNRRFLVSDTNSTCCKEQVMKRHEETGLPLLTKAEYKNGTIVFIYYKTDGSGIVDSISINKSKHAKI
jgi:hypothetical protein